MHDDEELAARKDRLPDGTYCKAKSKPPGSGNPGYKGVDCAARLGRMCSAKRSRIGIDRLRM
jgi:hypothetical protein